MFSSSDKKNTDELLRRIDELELRLKEVEQERDEASNNLKGKGEFVAAISHEFRTPLNGVIGMSDLLLRSSITPEQREQLLIISESARSLLDMINDVLDYSKLESGKKELENLEFELVPIVESVAELLAERARAKNICLMTYIDPAVPNVVKGDAGALRQILLNLCGNAVKFTEKGEVIVRCLLAEKRSDSAVIRISVADTGIGLSREQIGKLFTPYMQADRSITRKFGGTGLGLFICKALTELMGGALTVDSIPGRGSTFFATIPLSFEASHQRDTVSGEPFAGKRMLIVSQFRTAGEISRNSARTLGFRCDLADDASTAAAVLKQAASPFDVCLVIAENAVECGRTVCSITSNIESIAPKLVALVRGRCHDHGVVEFADILEMPLRFSEFLECFERALKVTTKKLDKRLTQQIPKLGALGKLILIADDSPVNQKVAALQLKSLGLATYSVNNGKEAVEAFASGHYSLILMDCEMPVMNGFEAAAAIRHKEQATGSHVPIVAMTGHAEEADKEACIAAGMDDFICKPIDQKYLERIVERWLFAVEPATATTLRQSERAQASATARTASVAVADKIEPLDFQILQTTCGKDVAREILKVYISAGETLLDGIAAAREDRDKTALESLAHQLKGSSQAVGASRIVELAAELESGAEAHDWMKARSITQDLKAEFAKLKSYAQHILAASQS